ncbi:MAG: M48 family metallopeptidase [Bacilli bacterium]|nr:M48 family metallopeptidase [Bacilli bacterium]
MKIEIDDEIYEVDITRKLGNKNTYLRVKEDLKIYVTTNTFVSNKEIERTIMNNKDSVLKMIEKVSKKNKKKEEFYYLGKKYDIIYTSNEGIVLGQEKVFINREADIDKWYKKEATRIFKERLDCCYNNFSRKIPYPTLTIRKMTTRWGVCNTKDIRVTLNLELMKKPLYCLDYVIMHELSHLIHPNHSSAFWSVVEENCKQYKEIRKIMKEE